MVKFYLQDGKLKTKEVKWFWPRSDLLLRPFHDTRIEVSSKFRA